jgi:hypothetical protein
MHAMRAHAKGRIFPMTSFRFLTAACLLAATPALASTPASWSALDRAAHGACSREIVKLAAKAKIAGTQGTVRGIGMGADSDRYYALVLNGATAGFPSRWLCLFDKRVRNAVAREIEK